MNLAGGSARLSYSAMAVTLGYSVVGERSNHLFVHGNDGDGVSSSGRRLGQAGVGLICVLPDCGGHGRSGIGASHEMGQPLSADLAIYRALGPITPISLGFLRFR